MTAHNTAPGAPMTRDGRPVFPLRSAEGSQDGSVAAKALGRPITGRGVLARLGLIGLVACNVTVIALTTVSAVGADPTRCTAAVSAKAQARIPERYIARPAQETARPAAFAASQPAQVTAAFH